MLTVFIFLPANMMPGRRDHPSHVRHSRFGERFHGLRDHAFLLVPDPDNGGPLAPGWRIVKNEDRRDLVRIEKFGRIHPLFVKLKCPKNVLSP